MAVVARYVVVPNGNRMGNMLHHDREARI